MRLLPSWRNFKSHLSVFLLKDGVKRTILGQSWLNLTRLITEKQKVYSFDLVPSRILDTVFCFVWRWNFKKCPTYWCFQISWLRRVYRFVMIKLLFLYIEGKTSSQNSTTGFTKNTSAPNKRMDWSYVGFRSVYKNGKHWGKSSKNTFFWFLCFQLSNKTLHQRTKSNLDFGSK